MSVLDANTLVFKQFTPKILIMPDLKENLVNYVIYWIDRYSSRAVKLTVLTITLDTFTPSIIFIFSCIITMKYTDIC